jgi:hypothetical protein
MTSPYQSAPAVVYLSCLGLTPFGRLCVCAHVALTPVSESGSGHEADDLIILPPREQGQARTPNISKRKIKVEKPKVKA